MPDIYLPVGAKHQTLDPLITSRQICVLVKQIIYIFTQLSCAFLSTSALIEYNTYIVGKIMLC